jgi:hypothetical protein
VSPIADPRSADIPESPTANPASPEPRKAATAPTCGLSCSERARRIAKTGGFPPFRLRQTPNHAENWTEVRMIRSGR